MAIITSRRSLITGLAALIAAPAIVKASSLMPVRSIARFERYGHVCLAPWITDYWAGEIYNLFWYGDHGNGDRPRLARMNKDGQLIYCDWDLGYRAPTA